MPSNPFYVTMGWTKCNVDGAFYEDQRRGPMGAVMRNDAGSLKRGRAQWYEHGLHALTMEALACRHGLLMAQHAGAQKVWLETDCLELVRLWNVGENQKSSVATILREIRDLSMVFPSF